jgi:hypothetical protein
MGPLTPTLSPSDGERVPAKAGEGASAGRSPFHGPGCLRRRMADWNTRFSNGTTPRTSAAKVSALHHFVAGPAVAPLASISPLNRLRVCRILWFL